MIERKRRPTSKNTQQPNQSPKEQVQKSNTSHAEEACRLRAGRRAVLRARSAPFSAPEAHRSARRERAVLRAGRRASCTSRDVPGRAVCAPSARSVRARGRPVRPFSSRSGLPELRGRAAGGRRHARRGPQVRRASPAHLRALARLEPEPGRKEVPPGFAVRFQRQKKAKRSTQRRRDGSGVRRARVQEPTAVESS